MANRYPLILDSSNNKIKELPDGDNLDLTGAGISSVSSVSVGTAVTIGAYGIHATGVVTATSFSGNGSGLTGVASTDNIRTATKATFLSDISVAGVITATGGVIGNLTGTATTATNLADAANITTGTISINRLGSSGTKDATTFLRGDNTFAVVDSTSLKDSGGNVKAQANPNGVVVTGILTATSFEGFDSLSAPFGSTVTFTVTVASKTSSHRYNGSGSSNGYLIDGVEAAFLTLTPGRTYRFDQSDSSNSSHPLRFYLEADKTTAYTTNVTTSGTPGSDGYTEITVSDSTPQILHYQCSSHSLMGNSVSTSSNIAGGFNVVDESSDTSCNVLFTTDATGTALEAKTGTNLTFNSSSGALTATSFVGDVTGDVTGNADTATALETSRTLAISGDATGSASFDGSANATIAATLANSGVSAGSYGGAAAVPVITVDAKGRITSATTTAVGSGLTVAGDSGSEDINLLTETLTISGGTNLTSNAASNGVTVNLDDNISLTSVVASGVVTATTFKGALTGNVTGNTSGSSGSCTGNAATATILETARSIGGVSFNGSADINLPGVNASGNQDTSGTAAVATNITVADESSDTSCNVLFTTAATGNLAPKSGTNLTFNSSSGALTATSFATGAEGSSIIVNSATITGPSSITIDPDGVGDNTGTVHILGDLQVEGTTTTIDSTTVNIADKNIQVATGAANDAAANGAGFTIDSGDGDKTFQFEATGDNFGSSENLNLASSKTYKINNTDVLSATTLGSAVVNSSLTSVGTLNSLDVSGALTGAHANLSGVVTANSYRGDGSQLTGITAEGTGAIGGLTIKNQSGATVGTAGSVATLDFNGSSGVTVTASSGSSGISTIVISAELVTDTSPQLGGTLDTNGNLIQFGDSSGATDDRLQFGASQDLEIYHDGSNSYIKEGGTGVLKISSNRVEIQSGSGEDCAKFQGDAAVELYYDNSKKFETTSSGITVSGSVSVPSDSNKFLAGASSEMQVFHDGTNSVIKDTRNSGKVRIQADSFDVIDKDASETMLSATVDGAVSLNYNGSTKLATNDTGVTVTGIVTATSFSGNGASLSSLNGSNISSGTIAAARVATLNQDTTGNAATATTLETARNIGGVSFDGSADINLPGVNASGNQDTSGNAATATTLETARSIGGVSFNGSADINLPGVNASGNQDTSGTAAVATNVTVADESSDTTCFPLFTTAATGDLAPKSGTNLTFNSSSGALTASSFSGNGASLTSLNASNISSGTIAAGRVATLNQDTTGNAATATTLETARNIGGVSFDGSANINLPGVNQAGNQNTSGTAAVATNITVADESSDTSCNVLFTTSATGNLAPKSGTNLTFNSSSGQLTATSFSGNGASLTSLNASNISSGTIAAGRVATLNQDTTGTATNATNFNVAADNSTNSDHYIIFTGGATGNQRPNSDTALKYNPSSNTLTAGNFNSTSDIALKDNVNIIDNAADMIKNLQGIRWNWKQNGAASLGVSAQNVETVAPELVTNGDDYKSVNYNGLIGILIEAVKEQGNQINDLKQVITELKGKS